MTSMSSMTSQSQRMQESTKALEVALDNVKELKSSLDCERTMRNNLESELSNLEDANRGLNNDLMDREREVIRLSSLIPAVTSSSDVAVQVDVRED
uniref:Uncharacterized protein n=2 Tax=Ciona intestinalis TaxID=7719 RepID=F6XPB5_CIOIN